MELTAERLREKLDYDPNAGIFRWRSSGNSRVGSGSVAGTPHSMGYVQITIDKKHYFAHRLAWLYVYGEWPPGQLDHRDAIRSHNRIENLRPATQSQNLANQRRRAYSRSGFKGVSWHDATNKWRAMIRKDGRIISLGLYATPAEAHQAYISKAIELFGNFARAV